MSTWFHNFQTKKVNCCDCGKEFDEHVESEGKRCFDCSSILVKRFMERFMKKAELERREREST